MGVGWALHHTTGVLIRKEADTHMGSRPVAAGEPLQQGMSTLRKARAAGQRQGLAEAGRRLRQSLQSAAPRRPDCGLLASRVNVCCSESSSLWYSVMAETRFLVKIQRFRFFFLVKKLM